MTVHPAAAQGYTANSEIFAKGRPDYPPQIADWLRDELGLGPGKIVLDLGAGTGKLLPSLLATDATVVAVEPVDAMRARLIERNPGVGVMAHTLGFRAFRHHRALCRRHPTLQG
jgi:SAM-dependent methyltransferase